jgi:hypothetical protein
MTPVWIIEYLKTTPTTADPAEAVITIGWRCSGTEVDGDKTYSGSVYSTVSLPAADPANFVPYPDLTQDIVLGWVWANGVDKDSAEAAVAQQIEAQKNPPVITPPLPWLQTQGAS